jgi:hypothetical protein
MRMLLTDDGLVRQLRHDIYARPVRTWEDYAAEVWDSIVVSELEALRLERESRS